MTRRSTSPWLFDPRRRRLCFLHPLPPSPRSLWACLPLPPPSTTPSRRPTAAKTSLKTDKSICPCREVWVVFVRSGSLFFLDWTRKRRRRSTIAKRKDAKYQHTPPKGERKEINSFHLFSSVVWWKRKDRGKWVSEWLYCLHRAEMTKRRPRQQ